jgi:hypothetical protein
MKRAALTLTIILALLMSTVSATLLVDVATANPYMESGTYYGEPTLPSINVLSPSEKLTYWIGSDVWLDFTVTLPVTWWYDTKTNDTHSADVGTLTKVSFSLNELSQKDANKISEYEGVGAYSSYSVNLGRLSAGQHTLIISVKALGEYGVINLTQDIHLGSNYSYVAKTKLVQSSASINVNVDSLRPITPPNITLLSPTNKIYYYIRDWTNIPYVRLEYKSDDTRLLTGYSLDGNSNITPVTNGTKLDIPIQSRRLTLYANDTFGNSATPQTVYYDIQRSGPTFPLSNTPITIVMAGIFMMAIFVGIGVGLLLFTKKRKR